MKIPDHSSAENRGLSRADYPRSKKISPKGPSAVKKAVYSFGSSGKLPALRKALIANALKSRASRKSSISRILSLLQKYMPPADSREYQITLQVLEEIIQKEYPEGREKPEKSLIKLLTFLRQEKDIAVSSREHPAILAESLQNPPPGLAWSLRTKTESRGDKPTSGDSQKKQNLVLLVEHPQLGSVKAVLSARKSGSSCTFYTSRSRTRRLLRKNFRTFTARLKNIGLGSVRLKVMDWYKNSSTEGQADPGINVWG